MTSIVLRRSQFLTLLCLSGSTRVQPLAAQGSQPPAALAERLIGTWMLVRYEIARPNGGMLFPFGDPAAGMLTYDATGHMSGQVMRPGRTLAPFELETPDQIREAYKGYVAYFGRYELNSAGDSVTHHVDGSLDTWRIGVDQVRGLQFSGDRLILSAVFTNEGERRVHTITWERAK